MAKKVKESFHRSKLKNERMRRLMHKKMQINKKKQNDDILKMLTIDSIEKLSLKEKKETLDLLYNLVISYPETNSDKLNLIMLFMKDNSMLIVVKASEIIKDIFLEILPSYRINEIASKQKESKEIEKIKTFERNICEIYLNYIIDIDILDKAYYKQENLNSFRENLITCIADLFQKFYYFNYEDKLYKILIDKLTDELDNIKQKAFISLYNVLGKVDNSNPMFNLKLAMIKRISNAIFSKDHTRFDKNVLDLFIAHRIEFPDLSKENEIDNNINLNDLKYGGNIDSNNKIDKKKARKELKEFKREKAKLIKTIKKERNEIESKDNPKTIYYMNLKILKKILLVYFDILKNKTNSPLLCSVFNGVAKLSENINVEILLDLQKCIYELIKALIINKNIQTALMGLKANLTIAQKLTKEIVSLHDSYLINSCYEILCELPKATYSKDDLYIIFEVIEMIFLKNREYSKEIGGAYIKRLSILASGEKRENFAIAILLLVKRILSKYSDFNFLIDQDDDIDQFNYTIVASPDLCNGSLTNIIKELQRIEINFHNSNMVKKVVNYIIKAQKVNIELTSLNFYDILLKH